MEFELDLNDTELNESEELDCWNQSEEKDKRPLASKSSIKLINLKSLKPREYLCKRLELETGTITLLCASGSSCKSTFLQYLASCVSGGLPLFKKFPVQKGKVLHLDQEQNETQTLRKYIRLAYSLKLNELNIDRIVLNYRIDVESDDTVEEELGTYFEGYNLVIIDSLKATTSADENSADIEPNIKMLKRLAEKHNLTVVLVHHKGKSTNENVKQSGRGHSSIYDSVDNQIDIDWNLETYSGTLISKKVRDGKMWNGIAFELQDDGDFVKDQNCSEGLILKMTNDMVSKKKDVEESVFDFLFNKGESNQGQIWNEVGGDKDNLFSLLEDLSNKGVLEFRKGSKNAKLYKLSADKHLKMAEEQVLSNHEGE